jgi:hypothetical protein
MFPIVLALGLIGMCFGGLAAAKTLTQKENPPSRATLMTLSGLGMACFLAAGAVLYFGNQ